MSAMYYISLFNQDISSWITSNVTNMNSMFKDSIVFNQDISNWHVSKVKKFQLIFWNCPMSESNKPTKFK